MAKRKQTKQTKPRKQVKRQTRHFQLRIEHPKDAHVKEILDYCRSQRREVTVIRDAIALYWALENDNLEALFEMFPQHRAKLTGGGQGGGGDLEQIKSMLEIIAAGRKQGEFIMQSDQPTTGKLLGGKAPALPVFEELDDEPTVLIRASTSTDSSMNFVSAMQGMQ